MVFSRRLRFALTVLLLAAGAVPPAGASVTVLVGEPFGGFGTMMPTGHTTIYLDRICADGPVKLRTCHPDEPQGVAIARLDQIGKVDWIASPIMDFLYGVDKAEDVPRYVTGADVERIRQAYRMRALEDLLPDGTESKPSNRDWWEAVGASYIRRMWGYQLATTREQDQAFVAKRNAETNQHHYRLHKVNCADFAAEVVNFYYPGTVKSNHLADFGIMSPKQVARSVSAYGHKHPETELKVIEIPQIAGTLPRSKPVWCGSEALLKTKRYLFTLIAIQPEAVVAIWVAYLDKGRWDIGRGYEVAEPEDFYRPGAEMVALR